MRLFDLRRRIKSDRATSRLLSGLQLCRRAGDSHLASLARSSYRAAPLSDTGVDINAAVRFGCSDGRMSLRSVRLGLALMCGLVDHRIVGMAEAMKKLLALALLLLGSQQLLAQNKWIEAPSTAQPPQFSLDKRMD